MRACVCVCVSFNTHAPAQTDEKEVFHLRSNGFERTISERPSLQAFWKRACLSSWGLSLKPVYLI